MALQDYNNLYSKSMPKKMRLTFNDADETVITNSEICSEEMSLEESLYSDEYIRFGACESACFKVRIVNSGSFKGLTVVVDQLINDEFDYLATDQGDYVVDESENYIVVNPNTDFGTTIPLGTFKVYSDEPSNDRMWRDLTCYDAMYDILNADVRDWYEGLTFPMTIKQLRDSFFTHLGITQETRTLINDNMVTEGNFVVEGTLSGKTIIEAICELNGVFGHINKANKMDYISVPSTETVTLSWYIDGSGTYEDYETDEITGVIARKENGDVGTTVGTNVNPYYIVDNPLIYGLEGTAELTTALTNLLNKISAVQFRPFEIETYGNPMLPVGTNLVINTKKYDPENGYQPFVINSFVNHKNMTGIQSLKDSLRTYGELEQFEEVNSITSAIKATKYKTHILENTIDTFRSEITNVESIVAYTTNMRSASVSYFTEVSSWLTDEEYENLIGTETSTYGAGPSVYFDATQYADKYFLELAGNGQGKPILYKSNGTIWATSKARTTALTTKTNTMIWEHESSDNASLVNFVLEDNLNYILAIRLTANVTPTSNGLALQFDLPNGKVCTRPVYKQGEMFTSSDTLSEGQTIYLEYIPYSDISDEPNPYGYKYVWNMLEDNIQRSTSLIEQLQNQIVLKVDSNGYLSKVNLYADADSGSTIDLQADNINFHAFDLNMETTYFELTSSTVNIDRNGITVHGSNFDSNLTANKIELVNTAQDSSALLTNLSLTFDATSLGSTMETVVRASGVTTPDVYSSTTWGGIDRSLNTSLQSLANVGNIVTDEPNAVNVANSNWTKIGGVTLPAGRWVIVANARFASSNTGRRGIFLSTSASVSSVDNAVGQLTVNNKDATSGTYTYIQTHWITSNLSSSTTFYLQAWQNSGSTLSTLPRIRAVRIR